MVVLDVVDFIRALRDAYLASKLLLVRLTGFVTLVSTSHFVRERCEISGVE